MKECKFKSSQVYWDFDKFCLYKLALSIQLLRVVILLVKYKVVVLGSL
jgi:hypothetical protein